MSEGSSNGEQASSNRKRKQTRQRLREDVLIYYGNGKAICACCGETELAFLSIDHINGGGVAERKKVSNGRAGGVFYSWLKKNSFPTGYQVLCHNCNQAKGAYGVCPHKINEEREQSE